ncbi:hypothetical protein F5Y19DRAFT_479453 [Xylariaceae sp. FL1651]|nr:hypothetical protein F5Y19DRAFT_479453 [Xylariaceae sp. FL1651]
MATTAHLSSTIGKIDDAEMKKFASDLKRGADGDRIASADIRPEILRDLTPTLMNALRGHARPQARYPVTPRTTRCISVEEAALAEWRLSIEADGEGDEVKGPVFKGFKQPVSDPRVWLLVLIQTGAVIGMSFTYFLLFILQISG